MKLVVNESVVSLQLRIVLPSRPFRADFHEQLPVQSIAQSNYTEIKVCNDLIGSTR